MHLYLDPPPFFFTSYSSSPPQAEAADMKVRILSLGIMPILLVAFLLSVHIARASRLLDGPQQGIEEVKLHYFSKADQEGEPEREGSWNIMGLKGCADGDKECMKGRMLAEAHLDYIYSQHHMP